MVSDFTFKCLIHFELIFMNDVRWIPVLFFCVYCPIFPAPFTEETIFLSIEYFGSLVKYWASLVAQLIKNLPAMQETWVPSLGWEDSLEKGKATHSSILAWRIPWTV